VSGLRERLRALAALPEHLRMLEERFVMRQRGVVDGLTFLRNEVSSAISGPALATVTVLCERAQGAGLNGEPAERWVPSVLGGEVFLHPGQSAMIPLMPQLTTRNYRWFVSGHPDIVCTAFTVGNESAHAAYGGTKFGEFEGMCRLGNQIRVSLEFKKAVLP
jgi:hypothetical protein